MSNDELTKIMENCRLGYLFLSRVYVKEVTVDFLKYLVETDELDSILGEFKHTIIAKDLTEVETDLAAEYAGLFLNMRGYAVAPFESVYTSAEHLLMQKARDEVVEIYRSEGLDKVKEFNEPEDHIGIELEFMAYLCQKTIDLLNQGDKPAVTEYLVKQKKFLETHLLNWVPNMCDDIDKLARHDFYKAIGQLTREFLEEDKEALEEMLQGGV